MKHTGRRNRTWLLPSLMILATSACLSPEGETPSEQRADVLEMRDQTLADLYEEDAEARSAVRESAGYAVFSNISSKIFILSTGNGYGVAVNNETGDETFMKMAEVGTGIGMGIKKFRAVFVFHDASTLQTFLDSGWDFGGDADAAATADEAGADIGGQVSVDTGMTIYQLTDHGLALSATVAGTKYWPDDELN